MGTLLLRSYSTIVALITRIFVTYWKIITVVIIKRGRVTFYITDEAVIVSNGDFQHSSYNPFSTPVKSDFHKFRDRILESQAPEFSNIVDVVELSSQYQIYGYSTSKPKLEGVECEYRP